MLYCGPLPLLEIFHNSDSILEQQRILKFQYKIQEVDTQILYWHLRCVFCISMFFSILKITMKAISILPTALLLGISKV